MPEERGDRELEALRVRLAALEERFAFETESIRRRIDALEQRGNAPEEAATEAVGEPEPVRLVVPPAEEATEVVVTPPPLPPQVVEPPVLVASAAVEETEGSFEMRFGRVWLVRIGIALLVTGLVLLGNYAYRNWIRELPAGVRLAALYLCALALAETGRRLARRENLRAFGEVVLAGGLAFFYYCTFAAHHVARLRVIESPVSAAVLLALAAGGIAAASWLRRAKGTAVLGVVLASYAVMLQPVGWMSCFSALVLAGVGLFFATRPGWNVPGWISLLASYGSFVGWRFLGAAGGGVGDPVLWFLPGVWLMFALPGITGRFRDAMGDRGKAWFTGANNGLFFLLYTIAWLIRHGDGRYWQVVAVMGAVWLACGVLGRRRSEAAGGTYVSQSLACLSLALVLKLEGWHLGLSLAGESLALAVAFFRFRGRSELAFTLLAAAGATAVGCGFFTVPAEWDAVPAWSAASGAAVLLAASHFLWRGSRRAEGQVREVARSFASFVFAGGILVTIIGWNMRVDAEWRAFALLAVALPMAALSFRLDRARQWPEPVFGALVLLVMSLALMGLRDQWETLPMACAASFALASCWVWRHLAGGDEKLPPAESGHCVSAALAAVATGVAVTGGDASGVAEGLYLCAGGLALIALGTALRCGALAPAGALLGGAAVARWIVATPSGNEGFAVFAGLVAMAVPFLPPAALDRVGRLFAGIAAGVLRLAGFAAWSLAWWCANPAHWFDWLAVTATALLLAARGLRRNPPVEVFGFLVLAIAGWLGAAALADFHDMFSGGGGDIVLKGWGLVLMLATMVRARALPQLPAFAPCLLALVSFAWITQAAVTGFGWRAVALAWTFLGFLLVTAGLLQRVRLLRIGGFLVLGAALVKVFAVDVWDFTAFLRVAAFLGLGVALLLLGLFYHRFAPVLKGLLEADRDT